MIRFAIATVLAAATLVAQSVDPAANCRINANTKAQIKSGSTICTNRTGAAASRRC